MVHGLGTCPCYRKCNGGAARSSCRKVQRCCSDLRSRAWLSVGQLSIDLPMQDLPSGSYVLRISNHEGVRTRMVVSMWGRP